MRTNSPAAGPALPAAKFQPDPLLIIEDAIDEARDLTKALSMALASLGAEEREALDTLAQKVLGQLITAGRLIKTSRASVGRIQ